eukprot:XP_011663246.1 PREDICTED: uncharacterized protein LOC105437850 [Strongylocentrotus purpuratus]
MGLFRVIVYGLEITALVAIVGLSIAVATVMGLLKADFDGGCPLYPTFTGWFIKLNDVSNCNFVIGMNSFAIFIAIIAGVYRLVELVKQKKMVSSALVPVFFVLLYLIVAILIMTSAFIVTIGFNKLCKVLVDQDLPLFDECIDHQQKGAIPPYDSEHFYDYLLTAETTAWLSFAMWISLSAPLLLSL